MSGRATLQNLQSLALLNQEATDAILKGGEEPASEDEHGLSQDLD